METVLSAGKRKFSRVGMVYFVYSILVFVLQIILVAVLQQNRNFTMGQTQLIASLGMYLLGLAVIGLAYKTNPQENTIPEKHSMKVTEFIQAFFMSYTLMFISNYVGMILTNLIGQMLGKPILNPLDEIIMEMEPVLLFITTVILAPIFEEIIFRKFLIDKLLRYGEGTVIILSGWMFGLFHGNLSQFPYAFTLGAFFAFIYLKTGRIWYPIVLHAMINFMGSIVSLWVIESSNYYVLMEEITKGVMGTDIMGQMEWINAFLTPEFMILAVYEGIILSITCIGLILWILKGKEVIRSMGHSLFPKGKTIPCVYLNAGMICYGVYWMIQIILSIYML